MASLSTIEKLSPEILERIAYHTVTFTFLGPPTDLCALCRTSRAINHALSFKTNSHLYAGIFRFKFDFAAPVRRLTTRWLTTHCLATELKKRFSALKRIRQRETYTVEDLWTSYLMMSESDGRNESQLIEWAGLGHYLRMVLMIRNRPIPGSPRLWFTESEGTALTVWLLWMTVGRDGIRSENRRVRQAIVSNLLHPFIVAGYRYPSIHAPDSHFYLPLCLDLESSAPHCSGPEPKVAKIVHFAHELTLAAPLLTSAALLATTVRIETFQDVDPLHADANNLPPNREAANALGRRGVTLEDVLEFHYQTRIPLAERCPLDLEQSENDDSESSPRGSKRYDEDWSRLVSCYDPWMASPPLRGKVYTPGALCGTWAGRFVQPNFEAHVSLFLNPQRPPGSVSLGHQPLYMTLREHHCLHPDQPLPAAIDETGGDDILNAWLPRGHIVKTLDDAIEVFDRNTERQIRYETFFPRGAAPYSKSACEKLETPWISDTDEEVLEDGHSSSGPSCGSGSGLADVESGLPGSSYYDNDEEYADKVSHQCSGVADILVTGETGERHGDAWGHYTIIGRVRPWDGLVVLLRTPRDRNQAHLGNWVFKGYIHDRNFVGRWRETSTSVDMIGFEGGFVMYKTNDS